jgi:DNA-binding beta-propeller fold protein YncE
MHQIAYDPVHDEIIASNPLAAAILFFKGGADGAQPPLRVIQGPKTRLSDPDKVAVDPVHNEVFVPESGSDSVLVFNREASGNVDPIRMIHGPNTKLHGPGKLVVDYLNNLLIVVDSSKNFLVFNRTDDGDVAPRAIVPTLGESGGGPVRMDIYPQGKKIFLRYSGRGKGAQVQGDSIGVWQYTAGKEIGLSLWAVIKDTTYPDLSIRGIGVNPEGKEVMALVRKGARPAAPALRVYHVPEVFQ